MGGLEFACTQCGRRARPGPDALACVSCAAPLRVEYGPGGPPERSGHGTPLPLAAPGEMVSLGEGGTPLIELEALCARLELGALWAKLESSNPTGSFKDRGTAVMVSALAEHGVRGFVEDSSGNAGASAAAYAARAGMAAHVFVPESAPEGKVSQIAVYGARVHRIPGPRERAADAARRFVAETGMAYGSHNLSPYFIEGVRSCADEAMDQLGGRAPEHVVMPVGNGSLLIAFHLALSQSLEAGLIGAMPRLHAVQASAVRPIVAAWSGAEWRPAPDASTIAGGIASAAPPRMAQIQEALRATDGTATAVEEADITRWRALIAEHEGVYAEPTSAAALAGLERLVEAGGIGGGETVLVPVTGSGLKDP